MTKIKRDQEKAEEFHEAVNSDISKQSIQEALGAGITQWLERRARDGKVSFRWSSVCAEFGVRSVSVTAVACKRSRSLC